MYLCGLDHKFFKSDQVCDQGALPHALPGTVCPFIGALSFDPNGGRLSCFPARDAWGRINPYVNVWQ